MKILGKAKGGTAVQGPPSRSPPEEPNPKVADVFSTTVIAPLSYIDRSKSSEKEATRQKIRVLKLALEQPGIQVGVYGESKSGKTMFAIKTVREAGYGFVIAEGPQISSVDGFWRHVAENLKINVERQILDVREKGQEARQQENLGLQFAIAGSGLNANFLDSREVRALQRLEIQTDVINSVRSVCLDFLHSANMCVIVDDFHQIKDPTIRAGIITDTKLPAGQRKGKYVFISITPEALFVGQNDEQYIGRSGLHQFPLWDQHDLIEIVKNGFAQLGVQIEDRQALYIERNSFFNPLNVQQICLHVCNACDIKFASVKPLKVDPKKLAQALSDFAFGLNFFNRMLTDAAEAGGADAAERKFNVLGVEMNIYELVFLALSSPGAASESGILLTNIRDKIRRFLAGRDPGPHLGAVVKRLADVKLQIKYQNSGPHPRVSNRPLIYDEEKKKLLVANPMLRVYLLWAYVPEKNLSAEDLRELLKTA